MPNEMRLEEEEEYQQKTGGEEGSEKKDGDATVAPHQPQSQATAEPQLQTEQPPPTSTTTQAAPQSSGSLEDEEEMDEKAKEEPPNECAELINDYDARVCEHSAALEEAIAHVHQNAAPVVEKVRAWKEAAKALSQQMAEQVVRDVQLILCTK